MCTLENFKTDLDICLGPKKTETAWMLHLLCSKEETTQLSAQSIISQWETADSNQFLRLRKQLGSATGNFGRRETFSTGLIRTMSKVTNEELQVVHNVIDEVDQAKRKIFVTWLRYNVRKPDMLKIDYFRRTRRMGKINILFI